MPIQASAILRLITIDTAMSYSVPQPSGTVPSNALAVMKEPGPPELATAVSHLRAGKYLAAYKQALPFVSANGNRLYCDANRLCAIACSEARQWTKAAAYWQALFAGEATAHNALQIATSAVMANKVEQGLAWAERARALNAVLHEMPEVVILTNMLSALRAANHMDAAFPLLAWLDGECAPALP